VFGQIKDDMVQANLEHLWVGKVKNYYLKSEFILKIINEKNYSNILWVMMSSYHVGFLWVIKETIRHVYRHIRFEKRVILKK
jgi:hypothetical protein